MSKKAHSKLIEDTMSYLRQLPECEPILIRPGIYGSEVGTWDIIICHRSKFLSIEIKVDLDTLTPKQNSFSRRLLRARGRGRVCRSMEDVEYFMMDSR